MATLLEKLWTLILITRNSSFIIKNQKLDQRKTIKIYDKIKSYVRIMEIALKKGYYQKI